MSLTGRKPIWRGWGQDRWPRLRASVWRQRWIGQDRRPRSEQSTLVGRALSRWSRAIRDIASSARLPFLSGDDPDLGADQAEKLRAEMRACLEARGGEALARAQAASIASVYIGLSPTGRARFFEILATEFGIDRAGVDRAIARYREAAGEADKLAAERALRRALVSPGMRLLTKFNALPEGTRFLIDMRAASARARSRGSAPEGAGCGLPPSSGDLVRHRLPAPRPPDVGFAGVAAREDHRVRGGARGPLLAGSAPSPRWRPALLRLLPSLAARRAADLPAGGAGRRARGSDRAAAGRRQPGDAAAARRYRDLLFDHQHLGRAARDQLRQFPDQAGGRRPRPRPAQPPAVRDVVPAAETAPLARGRAARIVAQRRAAGRAPGCGAGRRKPGRSARRPGVAAGSRTRGRARGAAGPGGGPLPDRPGRRRAADRPGSPLPPRQRRPHRAHQLAGRSLAAAPARSRPA